MTPTISVYAQPLLVMPEEMADGTVVVIDVLRASTTIMHALEAGAEEVIPCVEVDDARSLAAQLPSRDVILGGERNGLPIDGFHLGNSPREYSGTQVVGKTVVFTTTNGTRALNHARLARRILIGAFVNASAVFHELVEQEQIHLLCAGTNGQISYDDVLCAGMLTARLSQQGGLVRQLNAQAITAQETWLGCFALPRALGAEPLEPERLVAELRKSLGGQNLANIGLEEDILAAAQIDVFSSIGKFDPKNGRIRLA